MRRAELLARRCAAALAGNSFPGDTEGVEDEAVLLAQFAFVEDGFVRVKNDVIPGDAPGLVADDAVAVLACGIGRVAVAVVEPGWRAE